MSPESGPQCSDTDCLCCGVEGALGTDTIRQMWLAALHIRERVPVTREQWLTMRAGKRSHLLILFRYMVRYLAQFMNVSILMPLSETALRYLSSIEMRPPEACTKIHSGSWLQCYFGRYHKAEKCIQPLAFKVQPYSRWALETWTDKVSKEFIDFLVALSRHNEPHTIRIQYLPCYVIGLVGLDLLVSVCWRSNALVECYLIA